MIKNLSQFDRIIRVLIAIAILILFLTDQISSTAAVIFGVLALILLLTGIAGTCPIYMALKISTKKKIS